MEGLRAVMLGQCSHHRQTAAVKKTYLVALTNNIANELLSLTNVFLRATEITTFVHRNFHTSPLQHTKITMLANGHPRPVASQQKGDHTDDHPLALMLGPNDPIFPKCTQTVSYTHLTLPTKRIV